MVQIKKKVLALVVALAFIAGGAFGTMLLDGDQTVAKQNATWQVEQGVLAEELPTFLAGLDASCDVDIEGPGRVYTVAYACND